MHNGYKSVWTIKSDMFCLWEFCEFDESDGHEIELATTARSSVV